MLGPSTPLLFWSSNQGSGQIKGPAFGGVLCTVPFAPSSLENYAYVIATLHSEHESLLCSMQFCVYLTNHIFTITQRNARTQGMHFWPFYPALHHWIAEAYKSFI